MAVSKKKVTVASAKVTPAAAPAEAPKAATTTPLVKTETVKETVKKEEPAVKEPVKKETAKKAPAKKASAKQTTAKKTVAAKKEPAKKAAPAKRGRVAKADLKSEVCVQFHGKEYSQDDLVKIAKDVWKYDLKQKASELNSVVLYVKPEESAVYYVMNKDFTGKFDI